MPERTQLPQGTTTGVFPSQLLRTAIRNGVIRARPAIATEQVQPASLDLRLGRSAWRVRSSFLPGPEKTVRQKAAGLRMHSIDLGNGAVLEKGCVYIVRLLETLQLPDDVRAFANPKSSAGRLDVFVRIVHDRGRRFDQIPHGYKGPLYAEIAPRTFSIKVRTGSRLTQLRLLRGDTAVTKGELQSLTLHRTSPLLEYPVNLNDAIMHGGVSLGIDLEGQSRKPVVGWRARRHAHVVDIDRRNYRVSDFWEPVTAVRGRLVLDPDDFYILSTLEDIIVPPEYAAELSAFDPLVGEFRTHYAGFFDPGFGWSPGGGSAGSKAVLEVRSRDVPFMLEHGQLIGLLRYERMAATPDITYGPSIGSHYQGQKLKLARQFL